MLRRSNGDIHGLLSHVKENRCKLKIVVQSPKIKGFGDQNTEMAKPPVAAT
jgi:hypothetical protein